MSLHFIHRIILLILFTHNETTGDYYFHRLIVAHAFPYYKIKLSLGHCREKILFQDNKIWRSMKWNRVFDIYYKSNIEAVKVSAVDIFVVINNTDMSAASEQGVGYSRFSAYVITRLYTAPLFYKMDIYTCGDPKVDLTAQFDSSEDLAILRKSAALPGLHSAINNSTNATVIAPL